MLLPVSQITANRVLVDEAGRLVDTGKVDLVAEVDDWGLLWVVGAALDSELVNAILVLALCDCQDECFL